MNSHFSSFYSNTMTKVGTGGNLAYSNLTFCRNIEKYFCNNRSDQKNKQMSLRLENMCVKQ